MKFIPCSINLPPEDAKVLCVCLDGTFVIGTPMMSDYSKTGYAIVGSDGYTANCIAWAELEVTDEIYTMINDFILKGLK